MKLTPKCTLSSSQISSLYEQDKIAFPAGRYICLKQIRQSSCSYIQLPQTVDTILTIKCSPQRKTILTIQKLKDSNYSLSTYTIKGERKYLKLGITPSSAQIALSENDTNIVHCLLTFQEGVKLIQVDLSKMKVISQAFLNEQITEMQVSPIDKNLISLCGNGVLRLYQTRDEGYDLVLDLLKKPEGKEFIAHMWFDSIILIACTQNQIFYFRDNQLLSVMPNILSTPIKSISKVSKYFLIATETQVGIFSRNDDEIQLFESSQISEGTIVKMEVNQQEDVVILRLANSGYMISNIDTNRDYEDGEKTPLLKWLSRPTVGSISSDNISICQNKSLALFIDKEKEVIEIWNIESGSCMIKKQFNRSTDNINSQLITGSFHPNGYSLVLAFKDRIRLYHLTIQDIIMYDQINIKRIKLLQFSYGGHLLAYISGKAKNSAVGIINIYTGQQIMNTKINTNLQYISWNYMDDQLSVAGQHNIYNWKIGSLFKEREDVFLNEKVDSICYDYKTGKLLASVSGKLFEVESASKVNQITINVPKLYSLLCNVNKYIATDVNGNIYVDVDLAFNKAEKIAMSNGKAKTLNYLTNILYVNQNTNELFVLKSREEFKLRNQDFILINRVEIVKNREKLRNLQQLIQTYQTELISRLQHQRVKFREIKFIEQDKFTSQTLKMNQQFTNLTTQKLHIEKVSNHLFKTVEEKQLKAVETLEVLYQQKLAMERKKIMDLEQKLLEQNVYFQKSLLQINKKHNNQILQYKRELNNKSNKEEIEQKIKQRQSELISQYQVKLQLLELQNQNYNDNLQNQANSSISDLYIQINNLKRRLNISQVQNQTMRLQVQQLKHQQDINNQKLSSTESKIIQNQNKIQSLQKEVMWKDDLIKDKENKLYEYQYKISDLEKSKQVMNFRTTEIWRELEPKESEVERLKKKLYKLQSEFKDSSKDNYNTTQKLIKSETMIDHLKKDVGEVKNKLKLKTMEYEELALQIHRLVNDVDPRVRGTEILKVYQDLKFKKPQKQYKSENQKTDELNRHLVHLQQSLYQVNVSNDRYLKNKQDEMIRKMKQNAELITQLNSLRKVRIQQKLAIEQKDMEIARLQRQVTQITKNSSKRAISEHTTNVISMTAGTSSRKRNIKSSQVPIRPVESLETSFRMDNKPSYSTMRTRQTRILSANKTAIVHRGMMNESHVERTQISEIAQELEGANRRILQQERIIDELNRRLMNGSNYN